VQVTLRVAKRKKQNSSVLKYNNPLIQSTLGRCEPLVVRQHEIVSSHEVKSRANLSRPVVVAAQWVNQHEIMLGFEAVQESILT
jgi:hypothetical protein